ncbi:hypothetical protein ACQKIE_16160 [Luteibacter sp. NPDC031894]|uniref:hypothetical protein n=1 Tax=Luteibacter sp. NPDC031894 TaxID=3390572 RepID=UPI003D017718
MVDVIVLLIDGGILGYVFASWQWAKRVEKAHMTIAELREDVAREQLLRRLQGSEHA